MKTLYLDTNVLIQCRKLEQLPWQEISKDENIVLLISRPVQEEIDRMKHDGNSRRTKRSRAATTFIREMMLSETSKAVIRGSGPNVEVGFAPPVSLKENPFPFLDLSRSDDRIIAEAIFYRDQHPGEDVALLTHDTQPMLTSKHCGLAFIQVPDEWLLSPEPDDRDKKIAELENKLQKFEKSYPVIKIGYSDVSGNPLHVASMHVRCYSALSKQEIEELVGLALSHHPVVTDFAVSEPRTNPASSAGIDTMKLLGVRQRYEPPTGEEISKYTEELYPAWVESVNVFFKSLPGHLESPTREYCFSVSIENDGYSPAEHVLVEFNVSGGLFLMPIDDEDKSAKASPLVLPQPPNSPKGRWIQGLSPFESLAASVRAFEGFATTPFNRVLRDFSPFQPPKHDKNAFYWKPQRPSRPTTTWVFECDEFRHKTGEEVFKIRIMVPGDRRLGNRIFECRVSARNLHDPIVCSLPVKVEYENQDSFATARSFV